ncbi:pol polyprotein [Cucumis melo var. makuwa]|uniref:Pol polyprotein n=1 Tax=Cucumis melo var. makuwa TaxID=1194695 RepID=A0A5D3BM30_CUCMM|nr:pol polyprotein [Cucumis melo var. makuwa]TYJ99771.1 pol polyprotein [Cucumis melo var. makuwa]
MLLSLVVQEDLELEQLDVKIACLHGDLTEEIYMNQPQGYIEKDDMLLAGKSISHIKRVKTILNEEFDMKELRESRRILDIDISRERTKRTLTIDQSNYYYKVTDRILFPNWRQPFKLDGFITVVVALSSTEVEYVALSEATKEAISLKGFLKDFGISQKSVKLYCENQSTIHLSKNQQYHGRTKHTNIKFHFIREQIEKQEVEVLKVQTSENAADMLTKVVTRMKFLKCLQTIRFLEPEKE